MTDTVVAFNNTLEAGNFLPGNGLGGVAAAYDSARGEVFVADNDTNNVSVINDTLDQVVATIPVGSMPRGVAYDPADNEVFVSNLGSKNVSVISDLTNKVVNTISVGNGPYGIVYDAARSEVFVAMSGMTFDSSGILGCWIGGNNVTVISTAENKVVGKVPVGDCPVALTYDWKRGEVFVSNSESGNVTVINDDNDLVVTNIGFYSYTTGNGSRTYCDPSCSPLGIAYDAVQGKIIVPVYQWVRVNASGTYSEEYVIYVITDVSPWSTTMVSILSGVTLTGGVVFNSAESTYLSIDYNGQGYLLRLNDTTDIVYWSSPVGFGPQGMAYDSGTDQVFVTNFDSANVTVVAGGNGGKQASIPIASSPAAIGYDPSKGEMFVTDFAYAGVVYAISDTTHTVAHTFTVGEFPNGVVYGGNGEVFVTNFGSNSVSVLSDVHNNIVTTVLVGVEPIGVAYDPARGEVFVANYGSSNVSVINTTSDTVVATIDVGLGPYGVAYDSVQGLVMVTNSGSGNVTAFHDYATNCQACVSLVVGTYPAGIAYDPAKGEMFVANSGSDTVNVIDDTHLLVASKAIAVGDDPAGVAYDPSTGYVYVTNENSSNVSEISDVSNGAVGTGSVGTSPWFLAYDSANQTLGVANELSGSVSFMNPDTTGEPFSAGTVSPAASTIDSGQTVTLTATASGGTPPYSYEWAQGTSSNCSLDQLMPTETGSTLAVSPGTTTDYCVYAHDNALRPATGYGQTAVVTVNGPLVAGAGTPTTPTIDSGQTVTLTAVASGGTLPYHYQWYSGGFSTCASDQPITAATGVTYAASPTATTYYCYAVTDSAPTPASAYSGTNQVTVHVALQAGGVTPAAPSISSGSSITLTANPSGGTPPYTYQWYSGSSPTCSTDTAITGATGSTLSASPSSGTYYCYVVKDSATTPSSSSSTTNLVSVSASTTTFLGMPAGEGYAVVGGIVAVIVVAAIVVLLLRGRPKPLPVTSPPTPEGTSAPSSPPKPT